ncbi:MAG: hypothetical protein ABI234_14175 [Ktedonobacteraceae bacterium]
MFKPHRFNPLLKAVPNQIHAEKVSSDLVHGHTHEELLAAATQTTTTDQVKEVKQTTTTEHGTAHTTTEVVAAEVITKETPAGHGKVHKTTEIDATAEVTKTVAPAHTHNGDTKVVETTETLSHVHATIEGMATVEMTPPHPPREETPEYVKAHHHMTRVLDFPCAMCGVKNSTLKDPKENPFGAAALETHHYPIERSLLDACDPLKVGLVFPQVKDQATLEAFVDSEHNLMVLCDVHHRHPLHGIHHLAPQDFFVQPFLLEGYEVVVTKDEEAQAMLIDEQLVQNVEKRLKQ